MGLFKLPADLRDALLAYLRSRPYGEVVDGVKALEGLEPYDDRSDVPSPPLGAVGIRD